jgi:putative tricarboxylic transport membrane protein
VLKDQGWTDSFVTGDEFGSFLGEESQRVQGVLSELGLT